MGRFFSNGKLLSGFITKAINGRGFASAAAAAPQGLVSKGEAARNAAANMVKKTGEDVSEKVAWVPDPRTGFYRPENAAQEIDVAELRAMLLKKY